MAKEIPLTQGKVALVDDEDYKWLVQWKWYAAKNTKMFYARRAGPNKTKAIFMHREILKVPDHFMVDHVNGSGLDNRRENLRIASNRQNQQNRHAAMASIYPGVCWDKSIGKWMARITINKHSKYLGHYLTEVEAYKVYCQAVKDLTGEDVFSISV